MAIHRKGHRKPRLSEPLLATLKQNVQSPIRIIRPSPTPISPSYKAKAHTNVSFVSHNTYTCNVVMHVWMYTPMLFTPPSVDELLACLVAKFQYICS